MLTAAGTRWVTLQNNRVCQAMPEAGWEGTGKNEGFVSTSSIGSGDFGKFPGS